MIFTHNYLFNLGFFLYFDADYFTLKILSDEFPRCDIIMVITDHGQVQRAAVFLLFTLKYAFHREVLPPCDVLSL